MALSERLAILITANPQDAVRGFQKVGNAADKELGRADSRIDRLGTNMTRFGAGALAFAGVAGGALFKFAQASEEAHHSQVELDNAIANSPQLAGESAKSFTDLADAIQDKTAADGDQIVSAEAVLARYRLTGDEIRSLTPTVVDFAQATGRDMVSAATLVGKALDGNIGALKRTGISIDETAFAEDRLGAVQDALASKFGGFAEREGKTFAGSMQRLKNEAGDVAEGLGVGVVQAIQGLLGPVQSASDAFQGLSDDQQASIGRLATYSTAVIGAVGAVSFLGGQLIKLRDRFTNLNVETGTRSLNTFGKVAAGAAVVGGVLALAEGVKVLVGALNDGPPAVGKMREEIVKFADDGKLGKELVESFGSDLRGLKDDIEGPQSDLYSWLGFGEIQEAKEDIDSVDKSLAALVAGGHAEEAAAAWERLKDAAEAQGISVETLESRFNDYQDALGGARADADLAGESVDELGRSLDDNADAEADAKKATEEATQAYEEQKRAVDELAGALFGVEEADIAYQESLNGLEDAQAEVVAAQGALNEAIRQHGPHSLEAMAASEALTRAQLGLRSANLDTVQSARDLLGAMDEQIAAAGGNAAAQATLRDQLIQLRDRFPELRGQIDLYIARLNAIPTTKSTTVLVNTIGEENLDRFLGKLDKAEGNRFATVNALFPNGGGRASGGYTPAGWTGVVGEAGPEIVHFSSAGTVTPTGTSQAMVAGGEGVGASEVHMHVHLGGREIAHVVKMIGRPMREEIRLLDREGT